MLTYNGEIGFATDFNFFLPCSIPSYRWFPVKNPLIPDNKPLTSIVKTCNNTGITCRKQSVLLISGNDFISVNWKILIIPSEIWLKISNQKQIPQGSSMEWRVIRIDEKKRFFLFRSGFYRYISHIWYKKWETSRKRDNITQTCVSIIGRENLL